VEQAVQAVFPDRRLAGAQARRIARALISHVDGLTVQAIFDPEGLPMPQLGIQLQECIHRTLANPTN
jgi:hypothetical protein